MKSMICNECKGVGKSPFNGDPNAKCLQCCGNGVVTEVRLGHLVNKYWPERRDNGYISPAVCDEKIAALMAWWEGREVRAAQPTDDVAF